MSWWDKFVAILRNDTPWLNDCRWQMAPVEVAFKIGRAEEAWAPAVYHAVEWFNKAIGREMLVVSRVDESFVVDFMRTGHGFVGTIVVAANGVADFHAHAEPVYDKRRKSIRSALITLPARLSPTVQPLMNLLVRHEFGHALGLGHARAPQSFMWPNATESDGLLLKREADMLRSAYGTIQV